MSIFTIKPERIATNALGALLREIVIGGLVTNYTMEDFTGSKNDTLTVPIRARAVTSTRALRATGDARRIVTSDLSESSVAVKLTDVVEQGTELTDENVNLDLTNFTEQVLVPQMVAVAEDVEARAYMTIRNAPYKNTVTWTLSQTETLTPSAGGNEATSSAWQTAVAARKILTKNNVPAAGRVLLVGPDVAGYILTDSRLEPGLNPTGLGEGALRDAFIGRLAQFDVYESNLLQGDEAYAFHRSAFAFAAVAPKMPLAGNVSGAIKSQNGFSMRHILDYDADVATDRSLVTTWTGGASVNDGEVTTPVYKNGAPYQGAEEATQVRGVRIVVEHEVAG